MSNSNNKSKRMTVNIPNDTKIAQFIQLKKSNGGKDIPVWKILQHYIPKSEEEVLLTHLDELVELSEKIYPGTGQYLNFLRPVVVQSIWNITYLGDDFDIPVRAHQKLGCNIDYYKNLFKKLELRK